MLQVLAAPGVFVFGELLEMECVQELATGDSGAYVQLLELFAYGTYSDYKSVCVWEGENSVKTLH